MNKSYKPRHECGVFAVYGHPDAALLTYYGLFALQHRGQESAGIVTAAGSNKPFNIHRGMGLVAQVFQEKGFTTAAGRHQSDRSRSLFDQRVEHSEKRAAFGGRLRAGPVGNRAQRKSGERRGAARGTGIERLDFPDDGG